MFTAKLVDKQPEGAAIKFFVEFTDGETTVVETVIPQDEDGFNYWLKSRLDTFNKSKELAAKLEVDAAVEFVEKAAPAESLTDDEKAKRDWFDKVNRLHRIKSYLVDMGITTMEDPEVVALVKDINDTKKPEYMAFV